MVAADHWRAQRVAESCGIRFSTKTRDDVPEAGQDIEKQSREVAWQPLNLAIRVLLVTFGSDSKAGSAESKCFLVVTCLLVVIVHHAAFDWLRTKSFVPFWVSNYSTDAGHTGGHCARTGANQL